MILLFSSLLTLLVAHNPLIPDPDRCELIQAQPKANARPSKPTSRAPGL